MTEAYMKLNRDKDDMIYEYPVIKNPCELTNDWGQMGACMVVDPIVIGCVFVERLATVQLYVRSHSGQFVHRYVHPTVGTRIEG